MADITLNLTNLQVATIQEANGIADSPEVDFTTWLQGQTNLVLIRQYCQSVKQKKMKIAQQMVDFDIADKIQAAIDVIKLDKNADYEVKVVGK